MKSNKNQGYYKSLGDGRYVCPACGTIHAGAFARKDAYDCCHDMKPLSDLAFRQAEDILAGSYHLPTPRTQQPGDGVDHKSKWGHWRRGKKPTGSQSRADYNRVFEKLYSEMDASQVADLDAMFHDLDDNIDEWLQEFHRERSPDQKISYAWNIRNYQLLKIYIQEIITDAVKARERYIFNHPGEYGLKVDGDLLDNNQDSANYERGNEL